jgi:hypothetical protein
MAESPEDKDVDALIAEMQSTLDKLKAAQRKDVDAEDSEPEPKNLNEAEKKAQRLKRAARESADSK